MGIYKIMARFALLIICLQFFSISVLACDINGTTGLLPENNLRISIDDKFSSSVTAQSFSEMLKRVYDVYAPIISSKGGVLQMNNLWSDDKVNASAFRKGNTWEVTLYGGLARHPAMTDDAFMLAICHELGHHLGGAPRYDLNTDWASNEGQADYFASLKCLRRVFAHDDNVDIVSKMTIDPEATSKCHLIYKSNTEVALCQRETMAGKALATLFGNVLGAKTAILLETPSMWKKKVILDDHPHPQCRLDTFFQGSLCDKSLNDEVSTIDPIPGTCVKRDGYKEGLRPLCWYVPTTAEL